MNENLRVLILPLPHDHRIGVTLVSLKIQQQLPFAIRNSLDEARKVGLELARFFDCELVESAEPYVGILKDKPMLSLTEDKINGVGTSNALQQERC